MFSRKAHAKINLNLHITGRRDDGYHLLDSIMVFTDWGDHITLKPADTLSLTMGGDYGGYYMADLLSTETNSPNLVIRTVHAICRKLDKNPNFAIHIDKYIPIGAGLGGGSVDAAMVMHMINDYYDAPLSLDEMCDLALPLGAEMPVCLRSQSTRVQGIGDVLTPVDVPPLHIVIAWPDQSLMTANVFRHYRDHQTDFDAPLPCEGRDCMDVIAQTGNALQSSAEALCPQITDIIKTLEHGEGCQIARMTGSGSACFGVFDSDANAKAVASQLTNAVVTQTR